MQREKVSVRGVILVHIFLHSDRIEIRSISPYSVRMRENADQNNSECGQFSRSVIQREILDDRKTCLKNSQGKIKCRSQYFGVFLAFMRRTS